jgi:hypothetical protein
MVFVSGVGTFQVFAGGLAIPAVTLPWLKVRVSHDAPGRGVQGFARIICYKCDKLLSNPHRWQTVASVRRQQRECR